ncbi:hypothetical protein [Pedobacter mucosus]|uniref:hypothetical protein n=1 Tax=Pedobacter mucosus TaxID=2895286 RepID=UPI001EE3A572|nr:hypothetical protein [Pedobacter mucosus]UKT64227.1 hypothetical protein LOK61_00280 [Pedobacter mucosus]
MKKQFLFDILPDQLHGSQMDAVETRKYTTKQEADQMYLAATKRLLNINGWTQYAGMSSFQLIDSTGLKADRFAQNGDFIRIDIPGPGPRAGCGYDWVRIEALDEIIEGEEKICFLTVRPSPHPLSQNDETAHFLKSDATSTFLIRQHGNVISAEEHGRNELPNSGNINLLDKGRNYLVGMAAKLGLSYPQWKSLVVGLLTDYDHSV